MEYGIWNKEYGLSVKDWKTIAAVAAIVLIVWFLLVALHSPLESPTEIVIESGQSATETADALEKRGVISNKNIFVLLTLVTGNEEKIKAGKYIFRPGDTMLTVINSLAGGRSEPDDIIVTIPEGFNVFDIDKRLASFGLIKEGEFVGKYYTDEGQFFPDTYRFQRQGETVDSIAQKVKNHLNLKFKDAELVLSTLVFNNTLIKASILEKEARKEEDMRLVAGVIENRLERGMLLQIDATVSYGACLRNFQFFPRPSLVAGIPADKVILGTIFLPSGDLPQGDNFQTPKYCDVSQIGVANEIKIDGPYNTYTRAGLPPGPIANPGITAIRAVLDPIKSDYLYYLSPRGGGDLIFSRTAAEHAANRRKYLGL